MLPNKLVQWIREPVRLILFLLLFFYTLLFTKLAWAQHLGMRTHKADLGQIAQAVWNSSRGRFVEMTDNGFIASRLTDHVEPILLLISPVLWLWNDVRAMLLLQIIFTAIGGWLLYKLALVRLTKVRVPCLDAHIVALILVLSYLLSPQLQAALLTEFHAAPLAVPLILWAFWAIETGRWQQAVLAILLVAGVKEEMALLAAGLSGFAIYDSLTAQRARHAITKRYRRLATVTGLPAISTKRRHSLALFSSIWLLFAFLTIVCLTWFYVATFVIVPANAVGVYGVEESVYLKRYDALGSSPLDIVKSFVLRPELVWQIVLEPARTHYLVTLIAGFGFLGLIGLEILILCLPLLFANLFSSYPPQYYGDFHYTAPLIPYMAVAATVGIARLWSILSHPLAISSGSSKNLSEKFCDDAFSLEKLVGFTTTFRIGFNAVGWTSARSMVFVSILTLILIGGALGQYRQAGRGPWGGRYAPAIVTGHHQLLPRFIQKIPTDAAVMATAAVHPHVALRRYVYQFPQGLGASDLEPPDLDGNHFALGSPPTWALLDVTTNTDMAPGDLKSRVDEMLAQEWGVVDGADGFLLLKRGSTTKTIPKAFYDFVRVPTAAFEVADLPVPSSSVEQLDQGALTYLGSKVEDWSLWRQSKVTTIWAVGEQFDPMLVEPLVELRTPDAETFYSDLIFHSTSLIWYPPTRWQSGEVIRVTTPWLHLPRFWGVVVPASRLMFERPVSLFGRFALGDAFQRRADGQLAPMALSDQIRSDGTEYDPKALPLRMTQNQGRFQIHSQRSEQAIELFVEAWFLDRTWPHNTLDLLLRWQGTVWPDGMTVFVHLRQNGETLAQADGLPQLFVLQSATDQLTSKGVLYDWRQLTIPDSINTEVRNSWRVVIGLYDSQTGERSDLLDQSDQVIGNEFVVGEVKVEEGPKPDLACVMISLTCVSQPLKD